MQPSNNEKTQFQSQEIMHSKWLLCRTTYLMLRKQNILPLDLYVHFLEALLREVGHQYLVVKTSKVNLLSGTKKVCSVYDFLTLACKFLSGHLKTISDFLLFINCGMIFHSKSSHILYISLYRSKVLHKLNDRRVY